MSEPCRRTGQPLPMQEICATAPRRTTLPGAAAHMPARRNGKAPKAGGLSGFAEAFGVQARRHPAEDRRRMSRAHLVHPAQLHGSAPAITLAFSPITVQALRRDFLVCRRRPSWTDDAPTASRPQQSRTGTAHPPTLRVLTGGPLDRRITYCAVLEQKCCPLKRLCHPARHRPVSGSSVIYPA